MDKKTDYTGIISLLYESDDYLYIPNQENNTTHCDVYGIGYRVIKYGRNQEGKFDCIYGWKN